MPVARPLAPADSYVVGRLDVTTAADLRADLLGVLERHAVAPSGNGDDLVVDLSGVNAVDMVGVGLLVGVHRQAQRRGRRLVLTGVPPRVMRLLTATRLRRVLAVRDLPRPEQIRLDGEARTPSRLAI
ncbi:MAG TPA: STAS domain-containing protein [Acidothermaceae bacterium]|nr:STAS domain-containing protein [Acidothermaceae bacterium]